MIDYINGNLAELTPAQAVIDCRGVGYILNISLQTFSAIQGKEEVKLFAYEQIREDQWTLFGFATKVERELFTLLLTVNGIGGNTARMILSSFSPAELGQIITNGDERMLKGIKGIGLKTAQRIIVELKDKLQNNPLTESGVVAPIKTVDAAEKKTQEEAIAALCMLGFSPAPSRKVVVSIMEEAPTIPVEQIVKKALKML